MIEYGSDTIYPDHAVTIRSYDLYLSFTDDYDSVCKISAPDNCHKCQEYR